MTARAEPERLRVEARGLKCPWPVLRAARAMREAGAVTLLADDPVALTDVPALAQARGWRFEILRQADHFVFLLDKGLE